MLVSKDGEVVQCGSARARAIGHLEPGWKQCQSEYHIQSAAPIQVCRDKHDVKDRPRSGKPRITTDSRSFNSPFVHHISPQTVRPAPMAERSNA